MDKHTKKLIKRYIAWGCLAVLVAILSVMPLIAGHKAEEDGPQASILTTALQQQNIDSQVIGGGQLSSDGTEEITIPEAVKLTKYLVGNGDTVKKGDPIARVDKVSVMLAMSEVQKTLDYLAGEIADASSQKDSSKFTAQAAGTVKVIYGKAGDSVRDVMLEHGALAVLSLDDKMAVEIGCDCDLTYGDSVTVTLANGKEVEGFVESNINGLLIATIKDKDYAIGEAVSVSTEDGKQLGKGELSVHSPWNAAAYYGTIKKVNIKTGDKLTAGKQMFQLDVGDHSAAFQILANERQEYEELMQELFTMYDTGVLSAPCDGIVTGVDKDGAFLLAANSEEQDWFFQPLSSTSETSGWKVMLLSSDPTDPSGEAGGEAGGETGGESGGETGGGESGGETGGGEADGGEEGGETQPTVSIVTPGLPQGVLGQPYAATLQASDGTNALTGTWAAQGLPEGLKLDPATGAIGGTPTKEGNYVVSVSFTCDEITVSKSYALLIAAAGAQMPGMGDLNDLLAGMMGSMGGMGGFGGYSAAPAFEPYSLETITVASVTSQEKMTLEIAIDEQDIAKLHIGQEATVTVEALTGQSFPAVITSISNTGTNAGGSSKFSVKLTLSMTGDMLPGMNASAFLPLQSQSVFAIPVAALVEDGVKTMVYTGYDAKNETLINPVTVTTGVSDGESVQILSGLMEGDTVYYAYYDTLEQTPVPKAGPGF